jgi:MFS family permease
MVLVNFDNDRTWKGLLVLGLVLNLLVCFTSDLGLDTQVKMAVDENGALPWGDLRPEVAGFSDVDDTGDRSVLPLYQTSESLIKATGLVVFLGLIAYVYRSVGLRSAAVLSISPAFIFSIGRGYEEVYFALLFALAFGLFSGLWSQRNRALQHLIGGFLLMLIPYAKSMAGPTEVLLGGAALAAIGMAWLMAQSREEMRFQWTKQPITAAGVVAGATLLFIAMIGLTRSSPTLAVMLDHPLRYVSAVGFALLIGVVIFALFGMVLWPLVTPAHKALRSIHDAQIATMTSMISAATTALVLYIAALWTYESVLWDAAWPGVVLTMGNNGRYLTLLFIPVVVLLKHLGTQQGTPTLDAPAGKAASIALTLLLLLPISLLAGIHGQTMWTDEAAEVMPLEDGDHFLFVSDATLGMHWMYTFYEPLDAEANNITGHWRSLDVNWVDDLNQNLPQVTAIVLSPDVNEVPTGWVVESSGEADLLNGGGEWRVLTRT